MKMGFDDVFECFDYDKSGRLDAEEIANCLALMCGGSINDKIFAAFNLFDANDSMTLSFDELNKFIKCVFQIFYQIRGREGDAVWDKVQMQKLTLATAEKCFQDNRLVKGKGEVNYTQFMQWMTGKALLDEDELEAMEQSSKPLKKSDFANRKFKNTQDFIRGFMHE